MLESFLPVDLGRIDVILGMSWLYTMGYMGVDLSNLAMTFTRGNLKLLLKGDAALTKAEVTMKTMVSNWEEGDEGFFIEFQNITIENEDGRKVDPSKLQEEPVHLVIERLVREYECIFQTPTQLPPKRSIDHQIVMKEGKRPINV